MKVQTLQDLQEGRFYKVNDLMAILKNMGLSHSIYTIRNYESWKCQDYTCNNRHDSEVAKCDKCGGPVRPPIILSPRTRSGGKGPGHRKYTAEEIRMIVKVFMERQ